MVKNLLIAFSLFTYVLQPLFASSQTVTVHSTQDSKKSFGEVIFKNSPYGVLIYPNLKGLRPGLHGFHIHEHPSCDNQGKAAGSHYDPQHTNKHLGPYEKGHLGDLPVLHVDENGETHTPTLAPRLSMDDLQKVSLVIHEGGDNYSDTPPLGGGGKRVGCGVFNNKK